MENLKNLKNADIKTLLEIQNKKLLKSKREKERYNILKIPIECPICGLNTYINNINQHQKGKKCRFMWELFPDSKKLEIKQTINKLLKIGINAELTQDEKLKEFEKILNDNDQISPKI